MGILTPELQKDTLLVKTVMSSPSWIRTKAEELTEKEELLSAFFRPYGGPVIGGGIVHPVGRPGDQYTADDVVERAPGDEYRVVRAVDPEYRVAAVRDYGAKFEVTDEEIARNDTSTLNLNVRQLTNTLVRKLNLSALAAVEQALDQLPGKGTIASSAKWSDLITVGPLDQITPNAQRPLADMVRAQLAADEEQLGIKHDLLLVAPQQEADLRIGYGDTLAAVLASTGLELKSSPYVATGTAYVLKKGGAGYVGYETPLAVEYIDKRENRCKVVQAYAVPSYAVDQPRAVKKIVGLE
ncbi:major capsid protein [Prescottella subtropica]|uniref:major capsid protein n=1 Tax=Prescottella subtropica TaxID=2545757 RepID=UPI0010F5AD24|nr:major capsid protein [Prescottella subtropica]